MLHDTPLRQLHNAYVRAQAAQFERVTSSASRPGAAVGHQVASEIEYLPYGPADQNGQPTCQLIASFTCVEREYAAIRRATAILDSPHRGTLVVTGKDRRDFLNRMVTQELKNLAPGTAQQAFWLNRKGRIDADLLLIELGDRILIDLDIHQAAHTVQTLKDFIFSEEVEIQDVSSQYHHIAVHGKLATETISAACGVARFELHNLAVQTATIDQNQITIVRHDQTAEPGYELIISYNQTTSVWNALLTQHPAISGGSTQHSLPPRPIGWHAFNIARIEAGTPLMNIDFGPTNLPHETGLLADRVSFTKGCYLGQEIVARMENLGRPRQILVGLRVQSDLLPIAGAQVLAKNDDDSMGEEIGVITSSTLSPMLSAAPIAFAMLKTAKANPGAIVLVNAEGQQVQATAGPLRFWPPVAA